MNKDAAKDFSFKWNGHGDEERDYQIFWLTMLRDVFDVAKPEEIIEPQYPVQFENATKHIDIYIPRTKVLIEQKSFGEDLAKKYHQSDGEFLTPFEQAKRYADALPMSIRPRWIVVCNFAEFHIYDLQQMDSLEYLLGTKIYAPTVLKLENFQSDFARLKFIVDPNADFKPEVKISTDAAKIIRKICLAIDKNYVKRDNAYIDALSKLCARLVFCFYADDEKLFAESKFADYLKDFSENQLQDALQNFFDALNTPEDERAALKNFPYVDGGLFDEKIPIPPLDKNFKFAVERAHIFDDLRLDELGNFLRFSWREINPTIFGAMFEALFNEETRRSEGIHYTSIENIHKVIDPLFFDDLSEELAAVKRMQKKNRVGALKAFQDKLAAIKIFDPACGSGNFLTETYLSLRRLENEVLAELRSLNADIPADPVKVSPNQFYGIEINDFAVSVAKLALWIAEIQMLRKTSWIIGRTLKELPLRKNISVQKANALRVDWRAIWNEELGISNDKTIPHSKFQIPNYIIGNPPFRGHQERNPAQIEDMKIAFPDLEKHGKLDYVCAWHNKAADFVRGTEIRCAFLSTNSICQGETAQVLWKFLFGKGIHIDFARRTFKWDSDSDNMAQVHCVVVGFSTAPNPKPKRIFDGDKVIIAQNINAFLVDAPNIFIKNRGNPPEGFPKMTKGSQPTDGGNLIIEADALDGFLRLEPAAQKYIRLYLGAEEFINGKKRYCLWLEGVPMSEIEKMPLVMERVEKVREFRLKSATAAVRRDADKSTLFTQIRQPTTNFLAVPEVSSERRKYIPIGFLSPKVIASNLLYIVPDATLYLFGILTSSIHMSWVKTFCGRLESRYRYSPALYNNFPFCSPPARQRRMIERSAQEILNVRSDFMGRDEELGTRNVVGTSKLVPSSQFLCSYAKLYNEETMPDELRSAHHTNDFNVALAYGFEKFLDDEPRIVAELMKLYKALTS